MDGCTGPYFGEASFASAKHKTIRLHKTFIFFGLLDTHFMTTVHVPLDFYCWQTAPLLLLAYSVAQNFNGTSA